MLVSFINNPIKFYQCRILYKSLLFLLTELTLRKLGEAEAKKVQSTAMKWRDTKLE